MTRTDMSRPADFGPECDVKDHRGWRDYERVPAEIYARSFAAIRREVDLTRFDRQLWPVVTRLIHACGEPGIAESVCCSEGLVTATRNALAAGAPMFCDSAMVAAGIMRRLMPAKNDVVMTLNESRVPAIAEKIGNTRSAAAVRLWAGRIESGVVVIGNAPTALFHLLELLDEGWPKPASILAFPVGFVGAAESKAELVRNPRGCEYITLEGRRGGSAMAAAAVNSILSDVGTGSG